MDMLETIILLSGPVEQSVLGQRLKQAAPGIEVRGVETLTELLAVPVERLAGARLIGFTTPVVVPRDLLAALGYGAYNFHPGPPELPGLCPAQYAIYRGAISFGATAHRMVERVDAGPIVEVGRFEIPAGASLAQIEAAAYRECARLFWLLSHDLATREAPLLERPIAWGAEKSTFRSCSALCDIPLDIEPEELQRRVAAFGRGVFGIAPRLMLHGVEFRYAPPPPVAPDDRGFKR